MNEMSYQLSLLEAMNNRLVNDENMYKMICNTSSNAILYYHFAEKRTVHVGDWSHFFDVDFQSIKSFSQLTEYVEEEYRVGLMDCMALESMGKERDTFEFKMKDKEARSKFFTAETMRDCEELAEQIKALKGMKKMAEAYGFDISQPAKDARDSGINIDSFSPIITESRDSTSFSKAINSSELNS